MIRDLDGGANNVTYYNLLKGCCAIKSINNMEHFERMCAEYPNYAYFVPEDGEWVNQHEDGTQTVTPVKAGTFVLQMYSASGDRKANEVFFIESEELKDYFNRKKQFEEDKKNNVGGDGGPELLQ